MKLFVALAVVSPGETFPAPGPFALERFLFVMRTHVTYKGGSVLLHAGVDMWHL